MKVFVDENKLVTSTYVGRYLGVVPFAYAQEGSVVLKAVLGVTPRHAVNRGARYLRKNSRIAKWEKFPEKAK